MIDRQIGRYRITEKLGEGGMGTVFKAEDSKLERTVALKILGRHLADDADARERFLREAQAASALNHPHITTVYDLLEEEGEQIICMEYIDGQTLRDLSRSGPVPVERCVDLIIQVADALQAAHEQGILHRDIKSANIMVDHRGQARIMDFGLAHLTGRSQLTRTGTTLGTIAYAAPEQLTGGVIDARSEIFSLGVVLYEILTGTLPFSGQTDAECLYAILNTRPAEPEILRPDIPAGISAVVLQMLEKNPADRYENCQRLLDDLTRIQQRFESRGGATTTEAERIRQHRRVRSIFMRSLAAVAAIALGILTWRLFSAHPTFVENKVMILPFRNTTGLEPLDLRSQSLAKTIYELGLTKIDAIEPVDPQRSNPFYLNLMQNPNPRESFDPIRAIAAEFGAGLVVTGAFLLESEQLILTARCFDGRSGLQVDQIEELRGPLAETDRLFMQLIDRTTALVDKLHNPDLAGTPITPPSLQAGMYFMQAEEALTRTDYYKAIELFEQAHACDSIWVMPLLDIALMYQNLAYLEDPMNWAQVEATLARAEQHLPQMRPEQELLYHWLKTIAEGDQEAAFRLIDDYLAESPRHATSDNLNNAAIFALRTNRPGAAVKFFRQMDFRSRIDLPWIPAWEYHAIALHHLGRYRRALKVLRRGLDVYPRESYTWHLYRELIRNDIALGRDNRAGQTLEEAILACPDQEPRLLGSTAAMWRDRGGEERAATMFERVIDWYRVRQASLSDEGAWPPAEYADLLYQAGRWEEARETYDLLAARMPDNDQVRFRLGAIAARSGNRDLAEVVLTELAAVDHPYDHGLTSYHRACLAALLDQDDLAFKMLREAYAKGTFGFFQNPGIPFDLQNLLDYPSFVEWMRPRN